MQSHRQEQVYSWVHDPEDFDPNDYATVHYIVGARDLRMSYYSGDGDDPCDS